MPKKNLKQSTGYKQNPAMKMVTVASGTPNYADRIANSVDLDAIAKKTDNFANMIIDSRSGAYSKVVNNPNTGLGYKTNTSRQFAEGTNKKYPYLFSAFDQDANSDKNVLFSRPGSSDRGAKRPRIDFEKVTHPNQNQLLKDYEREKLPLLQEEEEVGPVQTPLLQEEYLQVLGQYL